MRRAFLLSLMVLAGACKDDGEPVPLPQVEPPDELGRCADFDENRQLLWGDLHVHTELSFDANMQGTRTTQADAYAFARGAPISLQPYDAEGNATRTVQIDRPLDFVMLSDHAEFLSTIELCNDPSSPAADSRQCQDYREANAFDADPTDVNFIFVEINGLTAFPPASAGYPELCGPDDTLCLKAGMDVWERVVEGADAAYDRSESCTFTAFPGYEWTGGPAARNLHRNVMFKNRSAPALPYSYLDEPTVEGLWARLDEFCLGARNGCDVLTIPHNTNLSAGTYFENAMADGSPFDAEYVATRNRMEPLLEIYQHKGASECLPGSTHSDEQCGFEVIPFANLAAANQEIIGEPDARGFVREALGEGLRLEASLGINPFQHGFVGGTDTHISASGQVAEGDFPGHGGAGQPNRFLPAPDGFPDIEFLSPGGLTAVWAEENAREAIFGALKRKETFATSGPRIAVRFFGGFGFGASICDAADLAARGYEDGVPMGGVLPEGSGAPSFVVSASQDVAGAPLQRIQIVKGWLEGDSYQTAVFEVAGDPNNGASVDLTTCTPEGAGFADLCAVWSDPDFDPSERAFYYARVLENPTCRWTTRQCVAADYDCDTPTRPIDFDCCDPAVGLEVAACDTVDCTDPSTLPASDARCCIPWVEAVLQERAWTSPIWVQP